MNVRRAYRGASPQRLAGAGLLVLYAGCTTADADRPGDGIEHRPSAVLERLQPEPLDGNDIGMVRDFDILGDTIYLLDALGRVTIVERSDDGLHLAGHFGRRGGGPGEFLQATSLAVKGSDIVVADGTRLQFFSRSGEPLATKWMDLPCVMALPSVAPSGSGVFVHGNCLSTGYVSDTMKAVLAWSADTASWHVIVETPRFTSDGEMGSVFGARNLLTTGPGGTHAFGGGEMNCIWRVADTAARPSAAETCPAAQTLYSADPPPGLEERMRASRIAGMSMKWPETLPVYTDRFVTDSGDVILLRAFTADSMVLQLQAPASTDLAVAPLNGLLGCKAAGCVWLIDESDTPQLIVLDRAEIHTLLSGEGRK